MTTEVDELQRLRRRVTELEVRAEWQDRTIGELDEVVRQYTEAIDDLRRELARMRDTLRGPDTGPHDEKPPHY